jgi:rRNA maturation endonuclease Nob1
MRLIKRKTPIDDAVRCPECGERLPDGAHECAMCGHDLHASGEFPADSSERSAGVS